MSLSPLKNDVVMENVLNQYWGFTREDEANYRKKKKVVGLSFLSIPSQINSRVLLFPH